MLEVITLLTKTGLPALPLRDADGVYQDTIFLNQIVSAALHSDFLTHTVATHLTETSCQALFMPSDASVYEIE